MGRGRVERQHTGASIIVLRHHRSGLHVRVAESNQIAGLNVKASQDTGPEKLSF